ncbi:MAG: transcription termination factor NusA [Holosporales bacterium]|jgi:N utilization substance protein A|nr:transcription termination factor NusA [Holosporales bacterium]
MSGTKGYIGGAELLQVVEAVAREKGLEREDIFAAMEDAFQKIGCTRYGQSHDIRASVDRKTGEVTLSRWMTVVETVEDPYRETNLEEAQQRDSNAKIGSTFSEELPFFELGRGEAQIAWPAIIHHIREAERAKQYEDFKDRIGEVVSGVVKRAEFNSVTLDLGHSDAMIRRDQLLPREVFHVSDRIRAYIVDVRREERGPQVFLSRTHSQFMARLFAQEVPEVYEHIIEIKAVARDPGSRAKMAVHTRDPNIDPIGACVGVRGSRVQAVVQELQGEKVDIIPWSEDQATFIVNALAPAEVARVVLDEETHHVEVVVPDDQLSLAIGRRGQNVRLASQLTGWAIDLQTESDDSEKRKESYKQRSEVFITALDCDEMIAHLLVSEGFDSPEDLALTPVEEIATLEGLDSGTAEELKNRAQEYVEKKMQEVENRLTELGVAPELMRLEGLALDMLMTLAEEHAVKTLDDLGDFSKDELMEALSAYEFRPEEAETVIMAARAHWFQDAADGA